MHAAFWLFMAVLLGVEILVHNERKCGREKNSVLAFQSPPQRRNTTFLENTYIISIVEEILVFVIVQKS